jgi:hypothetical protein
MLEHMSDLLGVKSSEGQKREPCAYGMLSPVRHCLM